MSDTPSWVSAGIAAVIGAGGIFWAERSRRLAKRALEAQQEDWYVAWSFHWDGASCKMTVTNIGKDSARNPQIIVASADFREKSLPRGDVGDGGSMSIDLVEFKRLRSEWEAVRGEPFPGEGYEPTVNIWIGWKTGLGLARHIETAATLYRAVA